jgi:hypothetical protein
MKAVTVKLLQAALQHERQGNMPVISLPSLLLLLLLLGRPPAGAGTRTLTVMLRTAPMSGLLLTVVTTADCRPSCGIMTLTHIHIVAHPDGTNGSTALQAHTTQQGALLELHNSHLQTCTPCGCNCPAESTCDHTTHCKPSEG